MSKRENLWLLTAGHLEAQYQLAKGLGIHKAVAKVLVNRGICDINDARRFLAGSAADLYDPGLMLDMDRAVARIQSAISAREQIVIYGDYDVDGSTACAVLYSTLKQLNADVEYYIPERQSEGYGLHAEALERLEAEGKTLIITVDCGIGSVNEVRERRADVIITDHHEPPGELPQAYAILNPKRPGCKYPEKNLAGVGVAFKLCQALWAALRPGDLACLSNIDLVAVGTVADIVPLTGENRILVKLGLKAIAESENKGIDALCAVAKLDKTMIDAGKIGFVLAPRINAVGRMAHARAAVELFLTGDSERARELAQELDQENSTRQKCERDILAEAEARLAALQPLGHALVVDGDDWHPGVIGIVASRLVDHYFRPTVVISCREGIGKGSCRSIPGFDMYQALCECQDLLVQFGGHRQAAGLTIKADKVAAFRERLDQISIRELGSEEGKPVIEIDSLLAMDEINASLVEQLAALEPYGAGNPSPIFACTGLAALRPRALGQEGRHLKFQVMGSTGPSDVLAWNMGERAAEFTGGKKISLAFIPEFNDWQGRRSIQLRAKDIRPGGVALDAHHLDRIFPDRECIARLYLWLKKNVPIGNNSMLEIHNVKEQLSKLPDIVPEEAIDAALTVLTELSLVEWKDGGSRLKMLQPPTARLDLEDSLTYRQGQQKREKYRFQEGL